MSKTVEKAEIDCILQQRCSIDLLNFVAQHTWERPEQWGRVLGLSEDVNHTIQMDYPPQPGAYREKLFQTLKVWWEKEGCRATIKKLMRAAYELCERTSSEGIRDFVFKDYRCEPGRRHRREDSPGFTEHLKTVVYDEVSNHVNETTELENVTFPDSSRFEQPTIDETQQDQYAELAEGHSDNMRMDVDPPADFRDRVFMKFPVVTREHIASGVPKEHFMEHVENISVSKVICSPTEDGYGRHCASHQITWDDRRENTFPFEAESLRFDRRPSEDSSDGGAAMVPGSYSQIPSLPNPATSLQQGTADAFDRMQRALKNKDRTIAILQENLEGAHQQNSQLQDEALELRRRERHERLQKEQLQCQAMQEREYFERKVWEKDDMIISQRCQIACLKETNAHLTHKCVAMEDIFIRQSQTPCFANSPFNHHHYLQLHEHSNAVLEPSQTARQLTNADIPTNYSDNSYVANHN